MKVTVVIALSHTRASQRRPHDLATASELQSISPE
eukprot:COSAG02_NODE_30791_length_545_cov_1.042601_1_plen_34_part_10